MSFTPAPKPTRRHRGPKLPGQRKIKAIETEPLEETEQLTVVGWLIAHGIRFHASPNGGLRHPVVAQRMKRMGCSPGFPDIMIFDPPPKRRDPDTGMLFVGAAVEMKRRKSGVVSPEQKDWLAALKERGWAAAVCRGCDEALAFLQSLGYGRRRKLDEEGRA